jgi:hypothetical protein
MLCAGYPPFYSDDPLTTCRKIVNWRLFLKFPQEIAISPAGVLQYANSLLNHRGSGAVSRFPRELPSA